MKQLLGFTSCSTTNSAASHSIISPTTAPIALSKHCLIHEVLCGLVAGGLTIQRIAEVMGASINTVKRAWCVAKAWLCGELANGESP